MTDPKQPFSFPVEVLQLPANGRVYKLRADDQELAGVATHLELVAVGRLEAALTLMPAAGGGVEVSGDLEADVTQSCVVSLQPVAAAVREKLTRRFVLPRRAPAASAGKPAPEDGGTEGWIDPHEDVPDPIVDGCIDLGHVVVEELALAIDLYPRVPGAVFKGTEAASLVSEPTGPFAALAGLKPAAPAQRRSKTRPKARR